MSVVNLTIVPPTLTDPYCFSTWQQVANDIVGGAVVQFDITGATVVLKQSTTPTSSQRDKLWFNTTTGRTLRYDFGLGSWVADHPILPEDGRLQFFPGLAADIDLIDGGTAGVPATIAGPFWEIDTTMQARFPVGVGTFPGSGVAIVSGATGGLDQLTVAQANLPAVTVPVNTAIVGNAGVTGSGGTPVVGNTYGSTPIAGTVNAVDATSNTLGGCYYTKGATDNLGSGTALPSVPPWLGGYWIKRTIRRYFTS